MNAAYVIGASDVLSVTVHGVPRLTTESRVFPNGTIQLPIVGAVEAAGKTEVALARDLTEILSDGLLVDPQVAVQVKEYRAHEILLLGQVLNPGRYSLSRPTTIIEAIALAGGLTPGAADEVLLQRRASRVGQNQDQDEALIKVDISGILRKGEADKNLAVMGGDVIHVPERQREVFYVVGAVNAPGAYELPRHHRDEPFLLSQALSQAGGGSRVSKMKNGRILRFYGEGPRRDLSVNFKAVLKGTSEDIAIRPNDVLFVPSSALKDIGYAMVGVVPGTVSAAAIATIR